MLDILPNALTDSAHVVLPGVSFAEKEGVFVNHKGLAQQIKPAIRPAGDSRSDARILMELAGRRGLFHAPTLRKEIAENIPRSRRWPSETSAISAFGSMQRFQKRQGFD